ncbi:MAG TPA: phage holin family protein [Verrucomicrobiae bacterium]|jgi:uncharacterized membrane protein YqjE|nr:phage holin family protein [Verrucomicrobiae bacterium]
MDDKDAVPPGLSDTLRRIGATILAILQNRLELLVVELHEDRLRVFEALLLIISIVALAFFTLALVVAGVIALIWNQFGIPGLFVLGGIGLVSTLFMCWRLHLRLKNWPLLPGTLEQLKKDRACLESK